MFELAESFEREKTQIRKMEKEQEEVFQMKIDVLKAELKEREADIKKLNDAISMSEEEYSRLNQTYTILTSQNEEALTLRLRTEARLKELFNRENEREFIFEELKERNREI